VDPVVFGGEVGGISFERCPLGAEPSSGADERRLGDEGGVQEHASARGPDIQGDGGVGRPASRSPASWSAE